MNEFDERRDRRLAFIAKQPLGNLIKDMMTEVVQDMRDQINHYYIEDYVDELNRREEAKFEESTKVGDYLVINTAIKGLPVDLPPGTYEAQIGEINYAVGPTGKPIISVMAHFKGDKE